MSTASRRSPCSRDPAAPRGSSGNWATTVARLHGVARPGFTSRIGAGPEFTRWSDYLAYRWEGVVARADAAGIEGELVAEAAAVLFPLARRFDTVATPVLCHRDLYLDNLLCDETGNLVAVLDFDSAEAWEPAADFQKLRWWTFSEHSGAESAFLAGYTSRAGALPDDFDVRVRVVEIVELVNGIANWSAAGEDALVARRRARLARFLT